MTDCCSLQNVASFQLLLVCCSESLTFQYVTSSLQGPPNYTYAGLHSNQILTVKVCPSKWTLPSPFLSGGWTLFILADGKANLTSFNFLFWLSTFRGCWCPICVFPQQLFASSWTRVYTLFDIYGFLICLLFVMFYSPLHSFPLYLLTVFPSLPSFLVLCLPHLFRLRWSSPDTTMVFSLEISPTAFRDAIWR